MNTVESSANSLAKLKSKEYDEEELVVQVAKSEEVPINAMARVVIQLGEELIENEIVALLEIIKNSYDADSKHVFIEVDTTRKTNLGQGFIRIRDNGNGMNRSQIKNGFLIISTYSKKEKKESNRYKRIPLGEKGVGRLSTQRLASFLNLRTKSWVEDQEYLLSIDWRKFEEDAILGGINASLDTKQFDYNHFELKDDMHHLKYLPKHSTDGKFGFTELTLYGLINSEFWNQKGVEKILGQEVLKLVSPYKKNDSINITIELTNEHLNKEIISTQEIDEHLLEKAAIYKVDFNYVYPFIDINMTFNPIFYKNLEGSDARQNLPLAFDTNHIPIDESIKHLNLQQSNDKFRFSLKKDIVDGVIKDADPGKFKGTLYIYNYAVNDGNVKELYNSVVPKYPTLFQNARDLKDFLQANAGVKIFRDMFRVLPYGNGDSDWLGLTKLTQSTGSFFGPKVANTVGYIEITSMDNSNLQEMTNRQGFILDQYGENFITICKWIATVVSREAGRQSKQFNILYPVNRNHLAHDNAKSTIKETSQDVKEILNETKKAVEEIRTRINVPQASLFEDEDKNSVLEKAELSLDNLVEKALNISSKLEKASDEIRAAKKLYEYSQEEVAPLFELSALGIIAEALTHELNKSNHNSKMRSQEVQSLLVTAIKKVDTNSGLISLLKRAYSEVRLIEAEANSIGNQIRHLAPGFRKRKTKPDIINVNQELKNIYINGVIGSRAEKAGIKVNIIEKGILKIESDLGLLLQVFDNLYFNSEYWLQLFYNNESTNTKVFNIEINENGFVKVWDSGLGIDPVFEKNLFQPFQTQKKDGRGLGLYIISFLMENYGGSIRLLNDTNEYGRKYIFYLDFSTRIK